MDKKELESNELLVDYHKYLLKQSWRGDLYRKIWLYPRINKRMRGKALDIGCGTGSFLKFRPNTIGIDVNKYNVDYCTKLGLEAYHVNEKWPFADGTFDSAIMDNVLEHIDEPSSILQESFRVIKGSGRLIIGVPASKGFAWDNDHKIFYNENLLKETVESFGFELHEFFHTPINSKHLENRMKQYCYFAVFTKK